MPLAGCCEDEDYEASDSKQVRNSSHAISPCVFDRQHLFLDEPSSFWASHCLCEWVNLRVRVPHVLRSVCDSLCNILAVLIANERIRHIDAC
jgi:hypothetical protein